MFCSNCGSQNGDNSRFCKKCGATLASPNRGNAVKQEMQNTPMQYRNPNPNGNFNPNYSNGNYNPAYNTPQQPPKGKNNTVIIVIIVAGVLIFLTTLIVAFILSGGFKSSGKGEALTTETEKVTEIEKEKETEPQTTAPVTSAEAPAISVAPPNNNTMPPMNNTQNNNNGNLPTYSYSKNTGELLPGSNSRYISESELYGKSREEVNTMLNEIYARKGRCFKNSSIQNYFENFSWYTPIYDPDEFDAKQNTILNSYEKENRDLIVKYMQRQGWR